LSNKDKYKRFCEKEKDIPIFFNYHYIDILCKSEEWDVLLYEKGNQIAAAFPYFKRSRKSFILIENPPLSKFLGPYILPEYRKTKHLYKIYTAFINQLPKYSLFNLDFYYSEQNVLPFYWEKYTNSIKYSYVIDDLSDLDKVYANFSSDYRNRKIPKASEIVQCVHDKSVKAYYEVNKMSIDRQNLIFPISLEAFTRIDARLEKMEKRKMFFAVDEKDQIHSVIYLIWDAHSSYMLLAGDNPELRKSGAGIFLVWEAIKYTKNVLKLNKFDFLGSMVKPIEITRRQFGAEQKTYINVKKYSSKILKLYYSLLK